MLIFFLIQNRKIIFFLMELYTLKTDAIMISKFFNIENSLSKDMNIW